MATLPGDYPPPEAPPPPATSVCRGCGAALLWHWQRGSARWVPVDPRDGTPHIWRCVGRVARRERYELDDRGDEYLPYREWKDRDG